MVVWFLGCLKTFFLVNSYLVKFNCENPKGLKKQMLFSRGKLFMLGATGGYWYEDPVLIQESQVQHLHLPVGLRLYLLILLLYGYLSLWKSSFPINLLLFTTTFLKTWFSIPCIFSFLFSFLHSFLPSFLSPSLPHPHTLFLPLSCFSSSLGFTSYKTSNVLKVCSFNEDLIIL